MAAGAIYLGFDYGLKRIGLAVGDDITRRARPLPVVGNGRQPDWDALTKVIKDWRPKAAVVGLPVDLDGQDQTITRHARHFAQQLRTRFGLPVFLCDERMSSRAADDEIRQARSDGRLTHRVQKGERDGVAARLILEQWLNDPYREQAAAPVAGDAPA